MLSLITGCQGNIGINNFILTNNLIFKKYYLMKTYANILDNMNTQVKKLEKDVQKLENNYFDTEDIIRYLLAYNEHIEVREIYHSFFEYCVRNDFDLDSKFIDITLKK